MIVENEKYAKNSLLWWELEVWSCEGEGEDEDVEIRNGFMEVVA